MKSINRLATELSLTDDALRELAVEVQAGSHSTARTMRKPDGTTRTIHEPSPYLGMILKKFSEILYAEIDEPPDHVFGFVKGRGIRGNASRHLDKPVVLRMDLADFFGSVSASRIVVSLQENGYEKESSEVAGSILTVNGALPIGFNTSPVLSNLPFADTDAQLLALAGSRGFEFTRYVDDLVFSGEIPRSFASDVEQVLNSNGWTLNSRKTRYMKRGGKQYVTGLSVSDSLMPRIPRDVKRRMRWKIHHIEKFGYDAYMSSFSGEELGDHPRSLLGMARHIASIEPAVGKPLLARLDAATSNWDYSSADDYWRDWVDEID